MSRKYFEHKADPLLPRGLFFRRMAVCSVISGVLLAVGAMAGGIGFRLLEGQSWLDSLLNAVTVMTGVGLEGELKTEAGKSFALLFSLVSPFIFYSTLVIFFTPILHRLLHHFHLELDQGRD